MKTFNKTLLIILLFFSLRLIQSCLTCPDDTIAFDFSTVSVNNLDNSGTYATWPSSDTMFSAAVAFEVIIEGDLNWLAFYNFSNNFCSFASASAMADCDPLFEPNIPVAKISIITLFDVSPEFLADSDVTELFYGQNNDFLYTSLEEIIPTINRSPYYGSPSTAFQVFCNKNVLNTMAQFIVRIELSNGTILNGTTTVVQIKPSK